MTMDENQLREFIEKHYKALVFFLMKLGVQNFIDAEAIANEAFLIFSEQDIHTSPEGLLFKTAKNLLINEFRKKKNPIDGAAPLDSNVGRMDTKFLNPYKAIEKQESIKKLYQSFEQLSEEDRMLVTLRYFEDKTIKQICQKMKISRHIYKCRLVRILGKLS